MQRCARPVQAGPSPEPAPGQAAARPVVAAPAARGTTPQMIGRYPDFDVFDAAGTWDAATAKVVDAPPARSRHAPVLHRRREPDAAGVL